VVSLELEHEDHPEAPELSEAPVAGEQRQGSTADEWLRRSSGRRPIHLRMMTEVPTTV
jgi:hypothetical protein